MFWDLSPGAGGIGKYLTTPPGLVQGPLGGRGAALWGQDICTDGPVVAPGTGPPQVTLPLAAVGTAALDSRDLRAHLELGTFLPGLGEESGSWSGASDSSDV